MENSLIGSLFPVEGVVLPIKNENLHTRLQEKAKALIEVVISTLPQELTPPYGVVLVSDKQYPCWFAIPVRVKPSMQGGQGPDIVTESRENLLYQIMPGTGASVLLIH